MLFQRYLIAAIGVLACGASTLGRADAAPIRVLGAAAPTDIVDFSLHLPLQNEAELDGLIVNQSLPQSPLYHHWLTPAQFRARYGPSPSSVNAALAALHAAGLQAAQTSTQVISVRGSAPAVEALLSTKLSRVADTATGRTRLAALSPYVVPGVLTQLGAVPLHLRQGIRLKTMAQRIPPGEVPLNRYGPEGSALGGYWADDLKQAYTFPSYKTTNGSGVSVAIVDGGDFSDTDLALYLQNEGVGPLKVDLAQAPVTHHILLPGANGFSSASGDSFEANLDAQQIALTAPGASLTSYITPDDSDGSFFDAFVQIVEANKIDIASWSYGECELAYTRAYNNGVDQTGILTAQNDVFKQGNAQGQTFVNSSGDNGALSCPEPGYFLNSPTTPPTVYKATLGTDVDWPNMILVGGGDLRTSYKPGSTQSTYVLEQGIAAPLPLSDPYGTGNLVALNFAATGGVSTIFGKPSYQKLVYTGSSTKRTAPDVGGHIGSYVINSAVAGSYDQEVFGGALTGVLGTSASAPDFAALLALKASATHSRLGLELPELYSLGAKEGVNGVYYFHDNNAGNDGYYSYSTAHHGYNYIYGLGSPHGANIIAPGLPLAGNPQTSSNP